MPKFNSIQEMWENYIEAAIEQRNLLALKVGRRAVEGLCDSVAYQLAIAATRDLTNDDMAPLIASSPRLLNMQYQGNTNLGASPSIGRRSEEAHRQGSRGLGYARCGAARAAWRDRALLRLAARPEGRGARRMSWLPGRV
jgi:hypothetical protein